MLTKVKLTLVFAVLTIFASAALPSSVLAQGSTPPAGTNTSRPGDCKAADIDASNCGILSYFLDAINLLSALVGIIVVIMIVVGGIQYSTARDNPQAAAAAKDRIRNALLALFGYLFVYAFLQYIVPGGVL